MENQSMLTGKLWNKILFFAIPIFLTSALEQLFNASDVAVVGQFAGKAALAAVGANGAIINLLVNTFVGISIGANVVISRYIGQNREDKVSDALHTSVALALFMGSILAILGFLFAPHMLELVATPESILSLASLYLRIYFIGVPFIILYNFEAAILRSRGETKIPLITLLFSGGVNVVLNLVFVILFKRSVDGVAMATSISSFISAFILFVYLSKDTHITQLTWKKIRFHSNHLKMILRIGVPAGLQGAVFSISNVIIQSSINGFKENAIAGSAAALNFEYFSYFIIAAFGQAAVTYVGQNYGAKNYARCHQIYKICLLEGLILSTIMNVLFILFANPLLHIFTTSPEVIEYGRIRIIIILSLEMFNLLIEVTSGMLRGYGVSLIPALIAIFGICGIRLIWVFGILPFFHYFWVLMLCYPVSWVITGISIFIAYLIFNRKVLAI